MSLSASDVDRILQLLDASSFDELELEMDGIKLALRRSAAPSDPPGSGRGSASVAPPAGPDPTRGRATAPATEPATTPPVPAPGEVAVTAPLLGTFYRAPKPGAAAYVAEGQTVGPDTIVGIIEVMKLMNTVRAGSAGTVTRILAQDGALVEYGEPLLHLRTAN